MIVEERSYTLVTGKAAEYLRLYEEFGRKVQTEILGHMIGYFSTDIGTLNQIVHLWGYESYDERARRRAALLAHPDWQAYTPKIRPLVLHQENRILIPATFSPIGGEGKLS